MCCCLSQLIVVQYLWHVYFLSHTIFCIRLEEKKFGEIQIKRFVNIGKKSEKNQFSNYKKGKIYKSSK